MRVYCTPIVSGDFEESDLTKSPFGEEIMCGIVQKISSDYCFSHILSISSSDLPVVSGTSFQVMYK